jgi:hypothetical protein
MKYNVNRKDLSLLRELRAGGIPIDEALMKEREAIFCGVELHQTGWVLENAIYDTGSGETCFALSVAIANRSDRNVNLQASKLEIPWQEWNFRWLPNPLAQIPKQYTYSHPAFGPAGLDPEVVLNHRFGGRYTLLPGDSIEGILLGAGESRVPDQYANRQGIWMRLSIFDGRGNRSDLNVILAVQRPESRRHNLTTSSHATVVPNHQGKSHPVGNHREQSHKPPARVGVGSGRHHEHEFTQFENQTQQA